MNIDAYADRYVNEKKLSFLFLVAKKQVSVEEEKKKAREKIFVSSVFLVL